METKPRTAEIKNDQPVFIPEELFDSFLKWNTIAPQMGTAIMLSVANTLFQTKSMTFTDFGNSKLSPEQIERLMHHSNSAHKAKNIDVKMMEHRLQELWWGFKIRICMMITNYLWLSKNGEKYTRHENRIIPPRNRNPVFLGKKIEELVRDRPDLISELALFFKIMSDTVESEEVLKLLKIWRETFDRKLHPHRQHNFLVRLISKEKKAEEVKRRMNIANRRRAIDEINKIIEESMYEKFPKDLSVRFESPNDVDKKMLTFEE